MKNIKQAKSVRLHTMCFLFAIALVGCGTKQSAEAGSKTSQPNNSEFNVLSVNSYNFDIKQGQAGGVIQFSSPDIKMCSLLFAKQDFKAGLSATITQLGEGKFDLTCLTETDHFAMSNIAATNATVSVDQHELWTVTLSFDLYSPRSKTHLIKNGVTLTLTKAQANAF